MNNEIHPREVIGQTSTRDREYCERLERLLAGRSLRNVLALWPAYVQRVNLLRFIAHSNLFAEVMDLPGCIVEVGVGRGVSLMTWSKLLEIFCTNDRTRKVYGFDSFEGLQLGEEDGRSVEVARKVNGGWKSPQAEAEELVDLCNLDNMIPTSERVRLIVGDVAKTAQEFLNEQPGLRIALLHIDCDTYAPTRAAMEYFFPLVLKGGIVVMDEYGMIPWKGETAAVDDYFTYHDDLPRPTIRKFAWSHNPHGYFVR